MIGDTATTGARQSRKAARTPGTAPEPSLAAERFERRHEGPGLAFPAPAELGVVEPRQGVEQGIEIGRDRETQMLEIVARIGDDGQRVRRQDTVETERELGAA